MTGSPQESEAFKKKREAHYNEFKLIQAMKLKKEELRLKKLERANNGEMNNDAEDDEDDMDIM